MRSRSPEHVADEVLATALGLLWEQPRELPEQDLAELLRVAERLLTD